MKGWAQKTAILENTKALAIRWWLRDYNVGVPCRVQLAPQSKWGELKDDNVWIYLYRPDGAKYRVQVPKRAVSVEHKWFKHSILLSLLPQALEIMHASSTAALDNSAEVVIES